MSERTAVFIDGGYLDALRNYGFEGKLDYSKLVDHAVGTDNTLLRAYYFTALPYQSSQPTDEERNRYAKKDKFLSKIRRLPRFEVRLGKVQFVNGEYKQKKVDILLAIELVSLAWKKSIDRAVIIAGDSDFIPAINQAKDAGVVVSLYYVKGACNDDLLDAVDERCEITKELFNELKK